MPSCPEGHTSAVADYCDVCGTPITAAHRPVWVATITADPDFYQRVLARGGPDTVEFPEFFPERRITLRDKALIGRSHRNQGVDPEIDLGIAPSDRGVSTQHAVLRVRDTGLTITDLGSTNGTSLNDADDLLVNGHETPLQDGDRIHVGAWTTITVARTDEEAR